MNMSVKSILIHPDFHNNEKWSDNGHDLALLKLSNYLKFNGAIQPISLPSSNYPKYNLFSGDLIFAGYGSEEIDTKQAERIQDVAMKYKYILKTRTKDVNVMKQIKVYLTMSVCNRYPYEVHGEKQPLLFSSTHGIWFGDSGGPLMRICPNSKNHEVIGIARKLHLCSNGIANSYTRISHYVPWIQKNLEKFDENPTYYRNLDLNWKTCVAILITELYWAWLAIEYIIEFLNNIILVAAQFLSKKLADKIFCVEGLQELILITKKVWMIKTRII